MSGISLTHGNDQWIKGRRSSDGHFHIWLSGEGLSDEHRSYSTTSLCTHRRSCTLPIFPFYLLRGAHTRRSAWVVEEVAAVDALEAADRFLGRGKVLSYPIRVYIGD